MAGFDAELAVKIGGDTSELVAATKRGSDEMRAFARDSLEAARIIEAIQTPQQAFAAKQERLNEHLRQGRMTTDQHRQATEKLAREFENATGITAERTEAMRRAAQITKEVETAEERYAKDLAEVNRLQQQGALSADAADKKRTQLADNMERDRKKAKGFGDDISQLSTTLQNRFSPAALAGSAAMSIFSAAVNEFRKEYEAFKRLTDSGEQGLQDVASGRKRLHQIFGRDEAMLRSAQADQAAIQTSLSRSEALELMFSAGSESFVPQFGDVARAAQLVGGRAGTVAGSMGSKFGASPLQAVGAFLAASGGSIADFNDLSKDAFGAAQGGESIGSTMDETLGVLAALTNEVGDSSKAANLMRNFGLKMQGAGVGGGGFSRTLARLDALDPEQRKKILGDNQELQQFINAMRKDKFQSDFGIAQQAALAEMQSGGSALLQKIEAIENDPALAAIAAKQNAQERLQIAGEKESIKKLRREAEVTEFEANMAAGGESGAMPGIRGDFAVVRFMRGEDADSIQRGSMQDLRDMGFTPNTTVDEELRKQTEILRGILQKPNEEPTVVDAID